MGRLEQDGRPKEVLFLGPMFRRYGAVPIEDETFEQFTHRLPSHPQMHVAPITELTIRAQVLVPNVKATDIADVSVDDT